MCPRKLILYKTGLTLYNLDMATYSMSKARENLPEAIEISGTEAVFLERYGKTAAVLVSPEHYDELLSTLEDAEDIAAFDESMAEEGSNIPWKQVKADLGWA